MRKIIHLDMDCFFAAVEMRDHPELRNVPLAIGGRRQERGVISTCNYPARRFGIRSAMPTHQALKLCPELVLLAADMEKYRQASLHVHAILHRYCDDIEPLSLDEAYLDVSHSQLFGGSATLIAEDIRKTIYTETGLTASAGVAPCKFLAKIASDENKPNGLFVIPPAQVSGFVSELPLHKIPGVGKKTAERLAQLGLFYCKDVQRAPLPLLIKHFGSFTETLLERSHGIDERPIKTASVRKSVAVEQTYAEDLSDLGSAEKSLMELIAKLQRRIERCEASQLIHKIGIKLKFTDFQQTTAERSLPRLDTSLLKNLLQEAWSRGDGKKVRLIGVHVGLKETPSQAQLSLGF